MPRTLPFPVAPAQTNQQNNNATNTPMDPVMSRIQKIADDFKKDPFISSIVDRLTKEVQDGNNAAGPDAILLLNYMKNAIQDNGVNFASAYDTVSNATNKLPKETWDVIPNGKFEFSDMVANLVHASPSQMNWASPQQRMLRQQQEIAFNQGVQRGASNPQAAAAMQAREGVPQNPLALAFAQGNDHGIRVGVAQQQQYQQYQATLNQAYLTGVVHGAVATGRPPAPTLGDRVMNAIRGFAEPGGGAAPLRTREEAIELLRQQLLQPRPPIFGGGRAAADAPPGDARAAADAPAEDARAAVDIPAEDAVAAVDIPAEDAVAAVDIPALNDEVLLNT